MFCMWHNFQKAEAGYEIKTFTPWFSALRSVPRLPSHIYYKWLKKCPEEASEMQFEFDTSFTFVMSDTTS